MYNKLVAEAFPENKTIMVINDKSLRTFTSVKVEVIKITPELETTADCYASLEKYGIPIIRFRPKFKRYFITRPVKDYYHLDIQKDNELFCILQTTLSKVFQDYDFQITNCQIVIP